MGALKAVFIRVRGERDRICVTRSNGTEATWVFPTYGDAPPHDLVHLVVEAALRLSDGFWGRVDRGADPRAINDDANQRGRADKYAAFGDDRRELDLAEAFAAAPWWLAEVSDEEIRDAFNDAARLQGMKEDAASLVTVARIRRTLRGLGARWRSLVPKGALEVSFDARSPRASFEVLAKACEKESAAK
jgi:hypothetical protein